LGQEEEQRQQQRVHNHNMTAIRRGGAEDLEAVAAIQQASPGAARWNVADYLDQDFRVAMVGNRIAGFLVARTLAADEREILNLAVAPEFRGKGVARALLDQAFEAFRGSVFLEVRESNLVAQEFYKSLGFKELSRRKGYYESPPETAIVMKFHSC
jgi:ribosomal-protein-alanine N-acetyltransferase